MSLQTTSLETMLLRIGRAEPSITGSTASLIAAQIGAAMVRMALAVSGKHGEDNDAAIDRLDSVVARIRDVAENDLAASLALIETYRNEDDPADRAQAITAATRQPLSAAHLLVGLLEDLGQAENGVRRSVESDFFGGVELIGGAFMAVMMAVETNLQQDEAGAMEDRTAKDRADLRARHEAAMAGLRSRFRAREMASR